jgi:isopenicillin N synthase-like dioxygenase
MSSGLIPVINIPRGSEIEDQPLPRETCQSLVLALQNSGFLLVTTELLDPDLQSRALIAARNFLDSGQSQDIITHPADPKVYAMFDSPEKFLQTDPVIQEYMSAMTNVKAALLRMIATGIGLEDDKFFVKLHDQNNNTLRLINYYPCDDGTGNRCKEHSDYGTITLLSTDGVSGLEAYHNGKWIPVPYLKGSLVVNIGSLLSSWTNGNLLATLHRVAGPNSKDSEYPKEDLIKAAKCTRTSIAFFADPNENVSLSFDKNADKKQSKEMSVAAYIEWRSGGSTPNRSGVGFIEEEMHRLH